MTDLLPMTTEQSTALARELLAKLSHDIAEDAMKTKSKIDRLYLYPPLSHEEADAQEGAAKTLWREHSARVEPIRREREAIIAALSKIEAMKHPQPFFISAADLNATISVSPSKATLSRSP